MDHQQIADDVVIMKHDDDKGTSVENEEEVPKFLFAHTTNEDPLRDASPTTTTTTTTRKEETTTQKVSLFDREIEQSKLFHSYFILKERFILISGYSGTGKTTLALSLRDHINNTTTTTNTTYFIKGKFDQGVVQRKQPYSAFISAFTEWVDMVLQRSCTGEEDKADDDTDELTRIRQATTSQLNPTDILLLIDTIPALKILVKPTNVVVVESQQQQQTTTSHSSSNRFLLALRTLIQAVVSPTYPMILLLDDLQWADLASLSLMEALIVMGGGTSTLNENDSTTTTTCWNGGGGFTILGTCRDNEVPATTHPLASTLRHLEDHEQHSSINIVHINLGNHSLEAVTKYVSKYMQQPNNDNHEIKSLAQRVYDVTNGNMLFLIHFMEFLKEKGWIYHDDDDSGWHYKKDKLFGEETSSFSDNVLSFLTTKILKLPSTCQMALTIAASVGAQVEESILKLLMEEEEEEEKSGSIRNVLAPAIEHGFLTYQETKSSRKRKSAAKYVFCHDRIQQAAYSLVPEQDREAFHLGLGKRLQERCKVLSSSMDRNIEEQTILFVLVGQMNLGSNLMRGRPEAQYHLASLNLRAGKRVVASYSAFEEGAMYFNKGLDLLREGGDKDYWRDQYDLTLDLLDSAAEVEYCRANLMESKKLVEEVLERARTFHDKLRAYSTQIYLLGTQEKMLEAMELGFVLLRRLGERFPKKATGLSVVLDIYKTKFLLRGKTSQDLLDLPLMVDIEKKTAMQILNLLLMYAYFVSPDFLPLLMFRMIHLTVKHGLCAVSSVGFEGYAMIVIGALGDIGEGTRYGKLGMELLQKFQAKEWTPRVNCLYYGMVHHWSQPLNAEGLLEGYKVGMETGDVEYAMAAINLYVMSLIHQGKLPLEEVEAQVRYYTSQVRAYKQDVTLVLIVTTLQFVLNLRREHQTTDEEDPVLLTGEAMNEQEVLKDAIAMNNITRICNIYNLRLALACIFGDYEVAMDAALKSSNVEQVMISLYDVVAHHTFTSLAAVSMARRCIVASGPRRRQGRKYVAMARKHLKQITEWAKHSPRNTLHKQLLLEAELMALQQARRKQKKKNDDLHVGATRRLFQSAIDEARKGGFQQMQAIGTERMALFMNHDCGDKRAAESLYGEAREVYRQWGATAKLDRLVYKH